MLKSGNRPLIKDKSSYKSWSFQDSQPCKAFTLPVNPDKLHFEEAQYFGHDMPVCVPTGYSSLMTIAQRDFTATFIS